MLRTADFNYDLPPELIAQVPADTRDASRLLVLNRSSALIQHKNFFDLPAFLRPGDLLVLNNSRVVPARLRGRNASTAGQFEIFLLEESAPNQWWVMLRPGKRGRVETKIVLLDSAGQPTAILAQVLEVSPEGHRLVQFSGTKNIRDEIDAIGEIPLPPYIARETPRTADRDRYQTVYAQPAGSVAAPTAGLHFTKPLLEALTAGGIEIRFLTLHVGLGTFAPVKSDTLSDHVMHEESFDVSADTARAVNDAKKSKRRVIAVGTTTVRVLESIALENNGVIVPGSGRTRIFIYPPRDFQIVDALITNFHLPASTLLMLVSAFASPGNCRGRELVLSAYEEAIRLRYRFFSYGDAMFIV